MEEQSPETGGGDETAAVSLSIDQQEQAAPPAPDQDANFLSLPAFRMMCLSNPLLDTFFTSQLPASFKLEVPRRATVNGTSIWHEVKPDPPLRASTSTSNLKSPRSSLSASTSAPATTTTFSTTNTGGNAGAKTYSKDVSTGVVGRLGGFLNNFLGEEVKSKVDDLADSLGEKLNTKVVRGPLPSFANLDEYEMGGKSINGTPRKKSRTTLGMDDLSAMEEQRREKRRQREWEEKQEEAKATGGDKSNTTSTTQLRGIDINAAQESLRMATEAIVEGTQTGGKQFGDDVPVIADGQGEEDDEEEVVVVDDDVVSLAKS